MAYKPTKKTLNNNTILQSYRIYRFRYWKLIVCVCMWFSFLSALILHLRWFFSSVLLIKNLHEFYVVLLQNWWFRFQKKKHRIKKSIGFYTTINLRYALLIAYILSFHKIKYAGSILFTFELNAVAVIIAGTAAAAPVVGISFYS